MFTLNFKTMENKTLYTQKEYATFKGVSSPYINRLMKKGKLVTKGNESNTKFLIVDCEENNKLFKKSFG